MAETDLSELGVNSKQLDDCPLRLSPLGAPCFVGSMTLGAMSEATL